MDEGKCHHMARMPSGRHCSTLRGILRLHGCGEHSCLFSSTVARHIGGFLTQFATSTRSDPQHVAST